MQQRLANTRIINWLDYVIRSCFSQIFCLKSREAIENCMTRVSEQMFNVPLDGVTV